MKRTSIFADSRKQNKQQNKFKSVTVSDAQGFVKDVPHINRHLQYVKRFSAKFRVVLIFDHFAQVGNVFRNAHKCVHGVGTPVNKHSQEGINHEKRRHEKHARRDSNDAHDDQVDEHNEKVSHGSGNVFKHIHPLVPLGFFKHKPHGVRQHD